MIYKLTNKVITILEHILIVAEKSAKQVQFCFIKGSTQYYTTPKKDILVSFELDKPIEFDYPIRNLKTFLENADLVLDTKNISVKKNELVLPTKIDIKSFEKKENIQVSNFKHNDLLQVSKLKFKYMNLIGNDNKFTIRYQNHVNDWWFDDGNKKVIPQGVASRKFRYIIKREKIRLLPQDYKLTCKKGGVLNFKYKHLNYYFKSEKSFEKQQVKPWLTIRNKVKDKHLIALYKSKGYM